MTLFHSYHTCSFLTDSFTPHDSTAARRIAITAGIEVFQRTRSTKKHSFFTYIFSFHRCPVLSAHPVCGRKWHELLLMRFNRNNDKNTTQKECFGVDIVPKLVLILIISIQTKFKSTFFKNPVWRETAFLPFLRPRVVRQKMASTCCSAFHCLICYNPTLPHCL